jgi:hypothetical protein
MLKILFVICICFVSFAAFCQSPSNYQIGTIIDVKPHPAAGDDGEIVSYDVSIKVGDTIYLTRYAPKPPLGTNTVKYAAGRGLLVLVGKNTITYNDILGRSSEVPIISQKPAVDVKESK